MLVIPAIDLYQGQVVRLHQGRFDRVTVYSADPSAHARTLQGRVTRLHVVDLEGARAGATVQTTALRGITAAFGPGVQAGGGIRTEPAAEATFALGVERVVLGTAAVRSPEVVRAIAARWPGRVVVAIDAKDGRVALDGWEELSGATAAELARDLADVPLAALLYTDIARDGTQVGPNMEATFALADAAAQPVIASGGVGRLDDLRALARHPRIEGAIVGRALYEGAFTLEEALHAAR